LIHCALKKGISQRRRCVFVATKTNLLYFPMVAKKIKNEGRRIIKNLDALLREEKLLKKKPEHEQRISLSEYLS